MYTALNFILLIITTGAEPNSGFNIICTKTTVAFFPKMGLGKVISRRFNASSCVAAVI